MSKPVWNDRHQINKQVAGKNKGSHGPPPSKPLPLPPPSKDMPWLNRRAKSEIDNAPPFSHRGSSGSRPSSKSSSTRPCSMDAKSSPPPPSNPRSLSKSTHHSTNSMPVPSASEQLDIRRLATQHLERHYNSMQNVKESRPPQRPKPMPPPLPLSARYKPPPPLLSPELLCRGKRQRQRQRQQQQQQQRQHRSKGWGLLSKGWGLLGPRLGLLFLVLRICHERLGPGARHQRH